MVELPARTVRALRWMEGEELGSVFVSLTPTTEMIMHPTHMVALYPTGDIDCAFMEPALDAGVALTEAVQCILSTTISPEIIQEHREKIEEYYHEIADLDGSLYAVAAQLAARYELPLVAVLFGRGHEAGRQAAILYTQTAYRIDRALILLRRLIKESGVGV